jgi:hypothetical protein
MKSKKAWKLPVVLILIAAATMAVISSLAQGTAAGDQIGIPGLESSVHRLQRNSGFAASAAILLEVFAGIFVAPWMRREESGRSNLRFVVDALFGAAVASVATVVFCLVFLGIVGYR